MGKSIKPSRTFSSKRSINISALTFFKKMFAERVKYLLKPGTDYRLKKFTIEIPKPVCFNSEIVGQRTSKNFNTLEFELSTDELWCRL